MEVSVLMCQNMWGERSRQRQEATCRRCQCCTAISTPGLKSNPSSHKRTFEDAETSKNTVGLRKERNYKHKNMHSTSLFILGDVYISNHLNSFLSSFVNIVFYSSQFCMFMWNQHRSAFHFIKSMTFSSSF